MASTPETIAGLIVEAAAPGFRDALLAKGQARSMIWREGRLPDGAPEFSALLSYDLMSFAYSMLSQGLRLLEVGGDPGPARDAFEHAASAIEAVVTRGNSSPERDFHRLVAGACYHLARYSARAFSLLHQGVQDANLTYPERALALLMLRDLDGLEALLSGDRLGGDSADTKLVEMLSASAGTTADGDDVPDNTLLDVVDLALSDHFMGAMATAMLAFERGEKVLLDKAIERFRVGLSSAAELNLVPQWWCHRLAIHLVGDLWATSFHERLPPAPTPGSGAADDWPAYRRLFIATLFRRGRAEIDLWPSQLDAAARAVDVSDNMVVSLPTSAGKTRVAELCILACLASGRRVVFVTPLRALSAQTEITLLRTFQPFGKTVSSLYGAIGVSEADQDFLHESDIIVATPEKLDFALRNDPGILDDVGLVVLDEGHMIGLTEREVRYEVQIQRLLRRTDAPSRRVVCLSAILPDGEQLADFTAWLTGDRPDGLVTKDWRPTRLLYGEVTWKGDHGRLDLAVDGERSWIENFVKRSLPKGRRTKHFPGDQRELCIATAWALHADGHSVLIFCPLRKSVGPFAQSIVDLASRGELCSVLGAPPSVLNIALAVGAEWLGAGHPILECLKLGVAIHHGALPTAFRKEVEGLLRQGALNVTVSSPTLAQGLNLSATTLLFHGLARNGELIDISEFRNVVGRAGRAYVDVEGLVLLPMYDNVAKQLAAWKEMVKSSKGKEMESGLLRLVLTLMQRMVRLNRIRDSGQLVAYLAGIAAWEFQREPHEPARVAATERKTWGGYLTTLDTAILSMLGETEVPDEQVEANLDEALKSSLWSRRLSRRKAGARELLKTGLVHRARFIWHRTTAIQRRGYFLAGVGLETGLLLDAGAAGLNEELVTANAAILTGQTEAAIASITRFAEAAFAIPPFVPDLLPDGWREILRIWLLGSSMADCADEDPDEILRFVEQALVYRLPWAMEAVRVRGIANADVLDGGLSLSDFELSLAAAAVETGSLNTSAAALMHAGFASRAGAIQAVVSTGANFTSIAEIRRWLDTPAIVERASDADWPTTTSHLAWVQFVEGLRPRRRGVWRQQTGIANVAWDGVPPGPGTPIRLLVDEGETLALGADMARLGSLQDTFIWQPIGLLKATVSSAEGVLDLDYIGPENLPVG